MKDFDYIILGGGCAGLSLAYELDINNKISKKKLAIVEIRDEYNRMDEIRDIFESLSIRVVEMSPDQHDKVAASSQGITHFIGRVLKEAGVRSTEINTLGFNDLLGVIEQTCNDSWDLFRDLQKYNPYTGEMIDRLIGKINEVHRQITEDAN